MKVLYQVIGNKPLEGVGIIGTVVYEHESRANEVRDTMARAIADHTFETRRLSYDDLQGGAIDQEAST